MSQAEEPGRLGREGEGGCNNYTVMSQAEEPGRLGWEGKGGACPHPPQILHLTARVNMLY